MNQLQTSIETLKNISSLNILISPLSIFPLLRWLESGEIQIVNRLDGITLANSLWLFGSTGCNKRLVSEAKKTQLPIFETRIEKAEINDWVLEVTQGKIKHIISQLSPSTRLALVNALHFKSLWHIPFEDTYQGQFSNGRIRDTIMMTVTDKFIYHHIDNIQIIRLPYKNNLAMWIFLPENIKEFIANLSHERIMTWVEEAFMTRVEVHLPQFRLSYTDDLASVLSQGEFKNLFQPSGLACDPKLFIDSVLHKAIFEVNQEGAEGIATTVSTVAVTGAVYKPTSSIPVIRIDHPFFFLVMDDTLNQIVFIGILSYPIGQRYSG